MADGWREAVAQRKRRSEEGVVVKERLPIQMPYWERLGLVVASVAVGSEGPEPESCDCRSGCTFWMVASSSLSSIRSVTSLSEALGVVLDLPFLERRRAFFEGGSGRFTSTSISSAGAVVRLRFLVSELGGGGEEEEDMVSDWCLAEA